MMLSNPHKTFENPFLGFGLGLRPEYYEELLTGLPDIEWLEAISENYLVPGGKPLYYLEKIRANYPVVLHGVSLSLGSTSPFDKNYLQQLKNLMARIQPRWISDHLCWTGIQGINTHDLLPMPYTQEALEHLVRRIQHVQDFLQQPILIENVSSYLTYIQSEYSEWDFLAEVAEQSGCYLLLDINNVYVSAVNHQFNPIDYLQALPKDRVVQIHLAGHSQQGEYIIDTHDAPIIDSVWSLYAESVKRFGQVSTLIERDDNMPPIGDLLQELGRAKQIMNQVLSKERCTL